MLHYHFTQIRKTPSDHREHGRPLALPHWTVPSSPNKIWCPRALSLPHRPLRLRGRPALAGVPSKPTLSLTRATHSQAWYCGHLTEVQPSVWAPVVCLGYKLLFRSWLLGTGQTLSNGICLLLPHHWWVALLSVILEAFLLLILHHCLANRFWPVPLKAKELETWDWPSKMRSIYSWIFLQNTVTAHCAFSLEEPTVKYPRGLEYTFLKNCQV